MEVENLEESYFLLQSSNEKPSQKVISLLFTHHNFLEDQFSNGEVNEKICILAEKINKKLRDIKESPGKTKLSNSAKRREYHRFRTQWKWKILFDKNVLPGIICKECDT